LDDWLEAAAPLREEVLQRAKRRILSKSDNIEEVDMRPILFCPIDDLEYTASIVTDELFRRALTTASSSKYAGYHLSSVAKEHKADTIELKPYPFRDRIEEVLPWWGNWEQDAS
jgi:hypothetical protein